jgi:hypothetical protein
MAMLPTRRGRNILRTTPTRPLEDIYERMGQPMNVAFGDRGLDSTAESADGVLTIMVPKSQAGGPNRIEVSQGSGASSGSSSGPGSS